MATSLHANYKKQLFTPGTSNETLLPFSTVGFGVNQIPALDNLAHLTPQSACFLRCPILFCPRRPFCLYRSVCALVSDYISIKHP